MIAEKARRIVYSVASSLDGYIAGPEGEFDWIPEDTEIDWQAFMKRFDTVLVGRSTYEVVLEQSSGELMPGKTVYVFSRTLRQEDHPLVKMIAGDAVDVVRDLQARSGKDIWLMGGGLLFESLLDAGLVDSIEVGLVPVLLGAGIPLLPGVKRRSKLRLQSTQTCSNGVVLLRYDVVRD
jgi:dihydrofolate reductase